MIDYSAEVQRIEDERCGNQWRRAEDYKALAARVVSERDKIWRELKKTMLRANNEELQHLLVLDNVWGKMCDDCARRITD